MTSGDKTPRNRKSGLPGKLKEALPLAAVMVLAAMLSFACLGMKAGYHIDEGLTLSLSNGNYQPFAANFAKEYSLSDMMRGELYGGGPAKAAAGLYGMVRDSLKNGIKNASWYKLLHDTELRPGDSPWQRGDDIYRLITVQEGQRFDYLSVYFNQAADNHPPFYYMLVHTVFSLFPGSFSNLYLFAVNLFFGLAGCACLYRMVKDHLGGRNAALAAVILYAFSQGFMSSMVFFRMYAALSFFTLWAALCHLRLMRSGWKSTRADSARYIACLVLGFYTHYYFLIFAALTAAVCAAYMLLDKRLKELLGYLRRAALAGAVSIAIWPLSAYHLLFSMRGREAQGNLLAAGTLARAWKYAGVYSTALFCGSAVFMLGVCVLAAVLFIVKRKQPGTGRQAARKWLLIMAPAFCYAAVIAKIAPYAVDRYVMCTFPFAACMTAAVFGAVMQRVFRGKKRAAELAACCALCAVSIAGLYLSPPSYLYLKDADKYRPADSYAAVNCVEVLDGTWKCGEEYVDMARYNQIAIIGPDSLSLLEGNPPSMPDAPLVVNIESSLDTQIILAQICGYQGKDASRARRINALNKYVKSYIVP